jgi:hypothetical protein
MKNISFDGLQRTKKESIKNLMNRNKESLLPEIKATFAELIFGTEWNEVARFVTVGANSFDLIVH